MRDRLEQIGAAFLGGYHLALAAGQPDQVTPALAEVGRDLRGFAFEGAAMGLALLDHLTPWGGTRIGRFLKGAGEPHCYMVHVAVGWVWARLPLRIESAKRGLDPLLSWLAYDGWGFHEGFFHWPKYIRAQPVPRRLTGYQRRVFDQGLGRSFWFVNGGNPGLIAGTVEGFPFERQADLWSGIGLAAVYAGQLAEMELFELRERAGEHWPSLAQGAAFAAKARIRAGNPTEYNNFATERLTGLSAVAAAHVTDAALENLPASASPPSYEIWRRRIQSHFEARRTLRNFHGN
jgi:hypothetical protein